MSEKKTAVELARQYFESIGYCLSGITDNDIEKVLLSEAFKINGWSEIKDKESLLREVMEQKFFKSSTHNINEHKT